MSPSTQNPGIAQPEPHVLQISVREVDQKRRAAEPFVLLDVREPEEWEFCRIEGSVLLPMSRIAAEYPQLDPWAETVVACHHGMRSMAVARFLQQRGFARVKSMDGGIDAWSAEIDPSVPRY